MSKPHFLDGPWYASQVDGMKPDVELHDTFIYVEPVWNIVIIFIFPYYHITILPLSNYHITILPYHHVIRLSYYHIIPSFPHLISTQLISSYLRSVEFIMK